jgi:hypothetical protein
MDDSQGCQLGVCALFLGSAMTWAWSWILSGYDGEKPYMMQLAVLEDGQPWILLTAAQYL